MLSGCAAPLIASQDKDIAAKDFLPPKDKSSLYIYRNESFGGAVGMAVTLNGKGLGETGAKTFFRINLPAGNFTVGSHAENYSDTQLTTEVGKNYFVWQEVKMGIWKARSELKQVDDKTGKAGVLESKLVTSLISDDDFFGSEASSSAKAIPSTGKEGSATSQKLRDLQSMLKDNLITEADYQKKKQQILEGM